MVPADPLLQDETMMTTMVPADALLHDETTMALAQAETTMTPVDALTTTGYCRLSLRIIYCLHNLRDNYV